MSIDSNAAELIDTRDNSHTWGQQYNRKLSDIFVLQKEIAKEITTALRVRLTGEEVLTATPNAEGGIARSCLRGDPAQRASGCFQGVNLISRVTGSYVKCKQLARASG